MSASLAIVLIMIAFAAGMGIWATSK